MSIPAWRQRLHDELVADEHHDWMAEARDFVVNYLIGMEAGITVADLGTSYLVGQVVIITLDDYDIGCAIRCAPHRISVKRHHATRWVDIIQVNLARTSASRRIQFAEALAAADTQYEAERKQSDLAANLTQHGWGL